MEKKTYSLELTSSQLKALEEVLGNIIDQSDRFGVFENNLLSDMAISHIEIDEPELMGPIVETVAVVSSLFLAIEKNRSILRDTMMQAMNLQRANEHHEIKVEIAQN
jgi:hypothetical protein